MGSNREFFWGQEGHEGKGAAKVAQRDCRRHSCCLLKVGGSRAGSSLEEDISRGAFFLGIQKEVCENRRTSLPGGSRVSTQGWKVLSSPRPAWLHLSEYSILAPQDYTALPSPTSSTFLSSMWPPYLMSPSSNLGPFSWSDLCPSPSAQVWPQLPCRRGL